ncbi:MAG TPA: hypothetical protein VLY83_00295, partial [Methanoregula sp.]|nr:hypothetical protein [Methanoregula sp.]
MPCPDTPPADGTDTPGVRMSLALQSDLFAWQEQLARSIARNNLALRSEGIATTVNQIACRVLFLRMAEDRGLIPRGSLRAVSCSDDRYRALAGATAALDNLWTDLLPRI